MAKKPASPAASPSTELLLSPRSASSAGTREQREQRLHVFAEAYLANGGNGKEAAIAAGYTSSRAANTAFNCLKHPTVKRILAEHRQRLEAELQRRHGLTIERVVEELAALALGDVRQLYHPDGTLKAIHELDDRAAAMVAGVEQVEVSTDGAVTGHLKKVKLWDKNTALTNAMKHLGLFEKDNSQGKEITISISATDAGVL